MAEKEWSRTDRIMKRNQLEPNGVGKSPNALPVEQGKAEDPDGIVAKMKANKLKREAGLKQLKAYYEAQLEVAEHRLKHAVIVKKGETELIAKQFLGDLNRRYVQYMSELGLENQDVRNKTLVKLMDQTAQTLREIESKNWPEAMVEETIVKVLDQNRRFSDELMKELGASDNS